MLRWEYTNVYKQEICTCAQKQYCMRDKWKEVNKENENKNIYIRMKIEYKNNIWNEQYYVRKE